MILLDKLNEILNSSPLNRETLLTEFESFFFQNEELFNLSKNESEIFYDLLYDFAFYEPDSNLVLEHNSLYNDEKLDELIKEALKKIEEIKKKN